MYINAHNIIVHQDELKLLIANLWLQGLNLLDNTN